MDFKVIELDGFLEKALSVEEREDLIKEVDARVKAILESKKATLENEFAEL